MDLRQAQDLKQKRRVMSSLKAQLRRRFGAAVAETAEILRHSPHRETARWDDILSVAQAAGGARDADRREFLELVRTARSLSGGMSVAAQ